MKKLFIIGSGGFSKQVIEIVEKLNETNKTYELVGLIDDDESRSEMKVLGYKIIGTTDKLKEISKVKPVYGVIAIADGLIRRKIVEKLKSINWINLVHPKAIISNHIKLGEGNIICAGTVINPDSIINNHCHININTTFGHDVTLQDYVTIMPGSNISGSVKLKSNSMIGTGAVIIQGLDIEKDVVIGAGSTVIRDTEQGHLYIGTPAIKVKNKLII